MREVQIYTDNNEPNFLYNLILQNGTALVLIPLQMRLR